ncbi:hypothetical protein AGMMS49574_25330 [Bacteroidia bacterium]|nr:hypothetical protein AGMMS49574_25330 [Bacteroidia bacterium]
MNNWKKLFAGVDHPSVLIFESKLVGMPQEVQTMYREQVYQATLIRVNKQSKRYQVFLCNYVKAHRQEYVYFLLETTILGALRYNLDDNVKEMVYKVINMLARQSAKHPHLHDLVFSLTLAFNFAYTLKSLYQLMRTNPFDETDLKELEYRKNI